ncbi:efflux transporter periplasmic adaptor subunit [Aliidiomarina minuta]|uniref:Efflux transporter periplasmic adaptor subunit n=1 Tax=Aliidiomarina minuta TaxID=880057 RepID=A0A432W6S3_9GAMM|nr:efflux RND transporter periplasmic adaptor subunit [Aliidiomarina minuta]RUO25775.1 efflux transporter periplasmic adaptor subunit [Aliidiomarina minuta]
MKVGNVFSGRFVFRSVTGISVLALLAACGGDPQQQGQQMPPAPVTVTQVSAEDLTHYGTYAGRVRGAREVEISAQVAGILKERRYEEGSFVEEGQTLFQIDPEPYEIQVSSARAELTDARSANRQAQSEWDRVSGLYERNAVSQRDYEQARSNRDAAQARIERAEAALADAQRNLRYTRVEAPVSGIAGMENISEGNLIQSGTSLTHVTQTDPIRVHFSVPENDAYQQRTQRREESKQDLMRQAWAILPDGTEYTEVGRINFIDPRVDAASASVSMRAEFDNSEGALIPGQFIRVRVVLSDYSDIFLIEPSAVNQGPEGAQVFLRDGDTARAQLVQLGPVVDGKQLVLDGLSEGDELIVNGIAGIADGASIAVNDNSSEEG